MSLEGLLEADTIRDYLYGKMRGAGEHVSLATGAVAADGSVVADVTVERGDEALALLREIRDGLKALLASREVRP
jgi:hypothetical protein